MMKKQIEVVAAVFKRNNTYFCAQRKDSGELARKWEFPGGKIELGESREEAIIREIKEELSATIEINKYITTVVHEYQSFILTMHAYACEVIEGELVISEHLDAKWLSIDEMAQYDFAEADLPIIEKLSVI
ncbi:MAG: (deoxy)nucleoside triphosphate pyrophosphohydrolase [Acholeplasma sp.]|nr:(deoxy)nucleoside triphosphate pyrophosphohydrolase [Acholeplasma sp.]